MRPARLAIVAGIDEADEAARERGRGEPTGFASCDDGEPDGDATMATAPEDTVIRSFRDAMAQAAPRSRLIVEAAL